MQKQDAYEYAATFKGRQSPPWLYALVQHWRKLLTEPFKGITSDGEFSLEALVTTSADLYPCRGS